MPTNTLRFPAFRIPGLLIPRFLTFVILTVVMAPALLAQADGYWERQKAVLPKGAKLTDGAKGTGMSRHWTIKGRVLRTTMEYTELDGSIDGRFGNKLSTYTAMKAWSLPPERIDAGAVFEVRCSVSARRTSGRMAWEFWIAGWLEGAGNNRKATQKTHTVKAAGGAGNKKTGVLRFRAPKGPKGRGRLFKLVVNGASRGFGLASLPVVYPYRWVESVPWVVDYVDANPKFWGGRTLEELKSNEVAASKAVRKGTATDGVSQLIIRIRQRSDRMVRVSIKEGGGTLAPAPFPKLVARDGSSWRFMLYTPRETFGGGPATKRPRAVFSPDAQPKMRLEKVLEVEELLLIGRNVQRNKSGKLVASGPPQEIKALLARPPVVLVHGLKSDPMSCWVKTHSTGQSFAAMLERAGMMPFLVNYQQSHGLPDDTRASRFSLTNARVVWSSPDSLRKVPEEDDWYQKEQRPQSWLTPKPHAAPILTDLQRVRRLRLGGIKAALDHYRSKLQIAATQADVIGHSMGGVLSRVYVSQPDYRRPENFGKGDIHRLITICSPHFGSELGEAKDALMAGAIAGEPWLHWGRRCLARLALWAYVEPESGAMQDLRAATAPRPPEGADRSALKSLDRLPSPLSRSRLRSTRISSVTTPHDAGPEFRYLYTVLGFVFFNNRPLLDEFINQRARLWKKAGPLQRGTDRTNRPPGKEGELGLPGHVLDWGDETKFATYTGIASRALDRAAYYWQMRRRGRGAREDAQARRDDEARAVWTLRWGYGLARVAGRTRGRETESDTGGPEDRRQRLARRRHPQAQGRGDRTGTSPSR